MRATCSRLGFLFNESDVRFDKLVTFTIAKIVLIGEEKFEESFQTFDQRHFFIGDPHMRVCGVINVCLVEAVSHEYESSQR